MKQFTASCVCGSRIELTDDAESLINPMEGEPDDKGRRYLIEVRADEWLERHAPCLEAKIYTMKKSTNGNGAKKNNNGIKRIR